VEVSAPVLDPALQQRIPDIIEIQWCDHIQSRVLDQAQSNQYRNSGINGKIRSQEATHTYLRQGVLPAAVRQARARWARKLAAAARARLRKE
jgi:polyphosphate kinase